MFANIHVVVNWIKFWCVYQTGPPQYRSSTIFEDATPELVRDFFWDDDVRLTWDDMLIHASILEECPTTGTMVVRWVRKVRRVIYFLCWCMKRGCICLVIYIVLYFFSWNSSPSFVATENT